MSHPPIHIVQRALAVALLSPCEKSKRGAVVFHQHEPLKVLGVGYNGRPDGKCDATCQRVRKLSTLSICSQLCVHAEMRAVRQAVAINRAVEGEIVHVKAIHAVTDGGVTLANGGLWTVAVSGQPSCWQCSREILDAGLAAVWLYNAEGWRRYGAHEFHELTLINCGLAGAPREGVSDAR